MTEATIKELRQHLTDSQAENKRLHAEQTSLQLAVEEMVRRVDDRDRDLSLASQEGKRLENELYSSRSRCSELESQIGMRLSVFCFVDGSG